MKASFSKSALCFLLFALASFVGSYAQAQTVDEIRKEREKNKAAEKSAIDDAVSIAKEELSRAYIQCDKNTYVTLNFMQETRQYNEVFEFVEFDEVQGFAKKVEDIQFFRDGGAQITFSIRASTLRKFRYGSQRITDWSDWSAFAAGQYLLMELVLVRRAPYLNNGWEVGKRIFTRDFQQRIWNRPSDKQEKWELRAPTCQEVKERIPSEFKK